MQPQTPVSAILLALLFALVTASPSAAQTGFDFEWRTTESVTYWIGGGDREETTTSDRSGRARLTLVERTGHDVRFAFEFSGPEGRGGGFIRRTPDGTLDPNFTFPTAMPPDLPPPDGRTLRGRFRSTGDRARPTGFEIVYTEAFVCRSTPETCGNVKRWERVFTGRAGGPGPPSAP